MVDDFIKLLPDSGVHEFQKLLDMKNVRKADQASLIELYNKKLMNIKKQQQPKDSSTSGGNPADALKALSDDSRIKNLQKMMKKGT